MHLTPWLIGATLLVVVGLLAAWSQDRRQKQLKAFRAGERVNDTNRMMRAVADKMSDAEIKAVSDYIAGLR